MTKIINISSCASAEENKVTEQPKTAHKQKKHSPYGMEINTLTDAFYDNLPHPLNSFTGMSGQTRDAAFLSSMVAFSAVLPNYGTLDGDQLFYPHMFFMLTGESGSGKSILNNGAQTIKAITEVQKKEREEDQANYTRDLAAFNAGNTEESPSEPPNTCTNIAANITTAAFFKRLQKQPHGGLMTLTELDAFSKNIATENGQGLSALMRAAWSHESLERETLSGRSVEIDCPKLAALFSGTPGQLKKLIGKDGEGMENGLLTRFFYYHMVKTDQHYKRDAGRRKINKNIPNLPGICIHFKEIYDELQGRGSTLLAAFKDDQQFDKFGNIIHILERMGDHVSPFFGAAIVRMAISCKRFLAQLTALRHAGQLRSTDVIYHCDTDIKAAGMLANVLATHLFFNFAPHSVHAKRKKNALDALSLVPNVFRFADFESVTISFTLTKQTAVNWLKKLLNSTYITKNEKGEYVKTIETNTGGEGI